MTNIYDVAKRAGLSKTLVSRVLNDKPGVSSESRQKILQAIKELNYIPNGLARSLVLQKTHAIGIVMDSLTSPYFFDLIQGFQEGGEEEDYNILFCDGKDDPSVKSKYLNYFTHHRVDGIVIYGSLLTDEAIIKDLAAANFPFVLIENQIKGLNVNNILIDNFHGAYKATEYLIKQGYRNIFHFSGDMNTKISLDRLNGYVQAMQDYGLPIKEGMIVYSRFTEESGYENMKRILSNGNKPEAVFFAADMTAFGAIRALYEAKLRVPDDVAIVGFDDDKPESRDIIFPGLTTVRQPLREIGKESIKLLVKAINIPGMKPESMLFPTKLIVRQSSNKKV